MKRLRICVCTAATPMEPRAARHAATLAKMNTEYEVVFLNCAPSGQPTFLPKILEDLDNLSYNTYFYPHKKSGVSKLLLYKAHHFLARFLFATSGLLRPSALSIKDEPIEKFIEKIDADIYIGHHIDTLLPVYRVAKRKKALMIFDCYEFYSDMGDGQSLFDRKVIRQIESLCLPSCDLVLASTDRLADELANVYGIKRPLPLYNVPPLHEHIPEKDERKFTLYWRNAVIDLGQRGLEEALVALTLLPEEITLHIQGYLPFDGGKVLMQRIKELGLIERVIIHPPHLPHEAVIAASKYTIGLCLERKGIRNHDLNASSKIFDYLMAGLAVVASDLDGLRDVIMRSKGGVLFQSGSPEDLANKVKMLYQDRILLKQLAGNARSFALLEGNLEYEMRKFILAFSDLVKLKVKVKIVF